MEKLTIKQIAKLRRNGIDGKMVLGVIIRSGLIQLETIDGAYLFELKDNK